MGPARPPVDEVQLFVPVAGTEKGNDRILRGKEEDDRELRHHQETYEWVRGSDLG